MQRNQHEQENSHTQEADHSEGGQGEGWWGTRGNHIVF